MPFGRRKDGLSVLGNNITPALTAWGLAVVLLPFPESGSSRR
jgi:hypothetical protein